MYHILTLSERKTGKMKLITYAVNEAPCCGLLTEKGIIDIKSIWKEDDVPQSVIQILERGPACLEKLASLAGSATNFIPLDSVKLLAPIPRPGKLLALAGNYSEHIEELGSRLGLSQSPRHTTVPRPFLMPPTVVAAPGEVIPWPAYSRQIDYEIELAVVIGRKAKYVTPECALDYVAGYTIANDVSARSVTFSANRKKRPWDEFYDWLNGKWADAFLPLGPYIITADEVPDPQNLEMSLAVNGRTRQKANTSQMIFPVSDIVSFLSNLMTLEPGDIIATGTPAGVGMATGEFLQAGDAIECKIEKLGTLTNSLSPEPKKFYEPLNRGV